MDPLDNKIKENIQVQSQGFVLSVQELLFRLVTWFRNLPKVQRFFFIFLIIMATVGVVAVRYGVEQFMVLQYKKNTLLAHSSFATPETLTVEKVQIIPSGQNRYAAYAVIRNENLDLSADQITYDFTFYGSGGTEVYNATGTTYVTPNEKKWIVVPRIETSSTITRATLNFGEITWQKRLDTPEVELRMVQPFLSEQLDPQALITEGTLVNNSPFALREANLVLVLYNNSNEVIAISQRSEFTLQPYERRAYTLQWPGISQSEVDRIELQAYTNTLDPNNLSVTGSAPNTRQTPDDR